MSEHAYNADGTVSPAADETTHPATAIGTASIVLGTVGYLPFIGVVPALVGLVLSIVGQQSTEHPMTRRRSRVGMWLSIWALVWFPALLITLSLLGSLGTTIGGLFGQEDDTTVASSSTPARPSITTSSPTLTEAPTTPATQDASPEVSVEQGPAVEQEPAEEVEPLVEEYPQDYGLPWYQSAENAETVCISWIDGVGEQELIDGWAATVGLDADSTDAEYADLSDWVLGSIGSCAAQNPGAPIPSFWN